MSEIARNNCRLGRQQELTREGHQMAKACYQQAIADDPNYLPAFAEYSYVLVREFQNAWGNNRLAALDEARSLAETAVALGDDPSNESHKDFRGRWYRAMVMWNQGDFNGSFAEYEAARKLIDPKRIVQDNADLDADMAEAFIYFGDSNRAITLIEDAMVRFPDFPYWYWWNLGRAYYMVGRYQDAIDAIARISSPPNDCRLITAASKAQLGDPDGQKIMAVFSQNDPHWTIAQSAAYPYGNDTARQHWLDGLRKAGLREN
ncbi:tetratricopeptide repeat protein [Rhizobium sp. KVB221]|uniref:Tetratricopeptide repeat protein n=1 Tax=Rhizobium setariae TaxID=2801340 RepID=A0A937CR38_9HYPH|nr:tetratricopeptide repeat protein [Rhizobium setariae]MBL0375339.1 tetratricopeptide repeat protein [Rhizobium setariae]